MYGILITILQSQYSQFVESFLDILIIYIEDNDYLQYMLQLLENFGSISFLYNAFQSHKETIVIRALKYLLLYLTACKNSHGFHPFELSKLSASQIADFLLKSKVLTESIFEIIWKIAVDEMNNRFRGPSYVLLLIKLLSFYSKNNISKYLCNIYGLVTNPVSGNENCEYLTFTDKWWYYFIPLLHTSSIYLYLYIIIESFNENSNTLLSTFHILFLYELEHKLDTSLLLFPFSFLIPYNKRNEGETTILEDIGGVAKGLGNGLKKIIPSFITDSKAVTNITNIINDKYHTQYKY